LLTATITGAVISSTVLKLEVPITDDNGTDELGACGADDCPWYNMPAVAQRPTDNAVKCICSLLFDTQYCSGFYS